MKERTLKVRLGATTIETPVVRDESTTAHIVETVNEKLREIEQGSARVDTQAFALQAAFAFAAELFQLREAVSRQEAQLLTALDQVHRALQEIVQQSDPPST